MWGAQLGPLLRLLLLLLSPRDGVRAEQPQAPGYLIAAPSVFRSGVEEAISVTIFNSPREVMVQAQLVALGKAVAQSQGAIQDKGTIKLKVPTGLRGQALLKVWGRDWRVEEGSLFHNQTSVTVDSRGASVFIQTDKPVYRPKHRVLISIFTVTPDLRPTSEKPVLGEWFVFVEMQGHVYNRSFEVQKYVLPKFELLIDPPAYIRDLDTCETGTVQARYTFGKPVSGTLTINMTVNGVGYYSQEIHGSQVFSICVKDMIPADVPEHFRGTISIWAMVTTADGSHQVAFDDSTPVQRQLVDIRYSKDTRKQFKPGLSYVGKVELSYPDGSPAEGVTVQIRAELTPKDNIYTVESVSQGGLVEFEIPSIPMSAQHVWLETKVTALSGKPVGAQYLPSYLSLSSWYSPSQCYLQLQPPSHPLQVGEDAYFPVKSTCPCNFTLYYEVAARGNIVLSGQQPAHVTQQRSKRAALEKPIRLMHLSETEPPPAPAAEVSVCMTSLQLAVTPSMVPLGRLLVFYVRENGEGVADSLQFTVETFFENQVFRELEDYDVSDIFGVSREDGPFWWTGLTARRRRRSSVFLWPWGITKDSGFAFAETGLVVMTDLVSLNHRQDGGLYTDEAVPAFQPHTGSLMAAVSSRQPPRAEKRKRTFFPETWVWHCLNISDPSGEETLSMQVPDSITSWVGEAVGLSPRRGLGIAEPTLLKTFKPFFVDFMLPPYVVRGEQAKTPLSIYNYLDTCAEVYVKISVPRGIQFVGHPGKRHLTKKTCVASGETEPTWVVLSFGDLGLSNITAKALAYRETSCCRDGKSVRPPEENYVDRRVPIGRDHIRRSVMVEPEGAPRSYTYSAFFCPNERVHISTPNKYEFQYVQRPLRLTRFDVAVRAHNDARVALSPGPQDTAGMIEIVLGGDQNTRSWISTSKMAPSSLGLFFQVGHGPEPSNESVIMAWTLPKPPEVQFIGFSTGWGSVGEFRIWRKVEADESYSEAFTLGVPHSAIPGSERAAASIIDVAFRMMAQLEVMSMGEKTDRQGWRGDAGRLTAFVLKSFAQARSFIFIDPLELEAAKDWIVQQQQADGSFPAVGRILNKDIQGGIHGTVPLTAYVVAALLEVDPASEEERGAITKARHFLESSASLVTDPYSSALTAYALTLLRSPAAPAALRKLRSLAITQDGVTHWSLTGSRDVDKDAFLSFSDGVYQTVVSAEVEMTAYALLTYTLLGDVATALPVVKWLSQQRNALGGFSSTQDTCVALQALAEYAILSYAGDVNLTVSLASTNLDYQETFELHRGNQKLLQMAAIDVTYNVPDPVAKPSFQLLVNLQEPEAEQQRPPSPASSADDDDPAADQHHQEYQVTLEVCTRWLHAGSSNMAVLEVPLLSGFRADVESLEQLLLDKHVALKRYELAGRRVLFYFDEIPSRCLTCVQFRALREHVVGRTSALPILVYDYYEPAFEATRFYNVSARSPLARELCAGPACNEVERALAQGPGWSPEERGPVAFPEEGVTVTRCGCARACSISGDPVCGSDGVVYASACHLQEAACRRRVRLEPAPPGRCALVPSLLTQSFLLEQPTPALALYSYEDDLGPLDTGRLAAGHELVDLEKEAEDSVSNLETKQAPLLRNAEVRASLWATQAAESQDPKPKLPQICHSPCSPI
ncbi:hypothetical protein MJG53_007012 [Ovis ammon polii x Ovis aries]|uniref:Uncharacterized protein n=1 Tax=Ovis ammon polii x Ovis aries TaxID=2918886 RepID=A0ACB9V242_9CETA|nr:hypothetical protein MJG53_007012 [Ovis ammon polii x Ovis aries]